MIFCAEQPFAMWLWLKSVAPHGFFLATDEPKSYVKTMKNQNPGDTE
jgi:hypothetical protein